MISAFNQYVRGRYAHAGFLQQQKALALAWICIASMVSLAGLILHGTLISPNGTALQLATNLPMLLAIALTLAHLLRGNRMHTVDLMIAVIVASQSLGALAVVHNGRLPGFFLGFGLYSSAIVLSAAIFARRSIFHLTGMSQIALPLVVRFFVSPETPPLIVLTYSERYHEMMIAATLIWAISWGFITIVDRALSRVQQELDTNRELKEGLEAMVAERTRELESARHLAEGANRAKSAFLANMSHEIRTPLHGIIGMTDLVMEAGLPCEQQERVRTIADSGSHLLGVIEGILDYSKIEAGEIELHPETLHLKSFVASLTEPLRLMTGSKDLELRVWYGEGLPEHVVADGLRLRQILTNLLGNAIKFTERGEVLLAVESAGPPQSRTLSFLVKDTGMGMSPEALRHVFERFRQADESIARRFGGTGLGLSISHMLAVAMGGRMEAASLVGQGTGISIHLPLVLPRPSATGGEDSTTTILPTQRDLSGTRILLVDDNATNRKVASGILKREGCTVSEAEDGRQALNLLGRQPFDLVLMDCQMPEMDGFEATRILRSWRSESDPRHGAASCVPVIALTASATKETQDECVHAGMDDILVKPYRAAQLREFVSNWRGRVRESA
jgi:signal transduction histidine kinase/CheY-like chemotaxis protein